MKRLGGHILIAAVGKMKTPHWKAAQEEYLGRLNRYTSARLVEVKDAVGHGRPDRAAADEEGRLLLKATRSAGRRIALDRRGRTPDSPELARYLEKQVDTFGKLSLLIGGPVGLSRDVLETCEDSLSLGPLTLPHELARVVFLEQLYRAATIINGEKYHK